MASKNRNNAPGQLLFLASLAALLMLLVLTDFGRTQGLFNTGTFAGFFPMGR